MSDNRRACVMHQKIIFKDITSSSKLPQLNVPNSIEANQRHKFYHSEECFKSWINKKSKSNQSHRTGISYDTRIRANGENFLLSPNSGRHMYKKEFHNFKIELNYKASTLKKQQQRRERHQRRIFKDELKQPILNPNDRLMKARQKNFLFTPDQSIRKRIIHLKYTKHDKDTRLPAPQDYFYRVPYFFFTRNTKHNINNTVLYGRINKDITLPASPPTKVGTSATPTLPVIKHQLIPNWIRLPSDVKVKPEHLPFVPNKPLFSNSGKLTIPQVHKYGINISTELILQLKIEHDQMNYKENETKKSQLHVITGRLGKNTNQEREKLIG
jgi:hypothetical protein